MHLKVEARDLFKFCFMLSIVYPPEISIHQFFYFSFSFSLTSFKNTSWLYDNPFRDGVQCFAYFLQFCLHFDTRAPQKICRFRGMLLVFHASTFKHWHHSRLVGPYLTSPITSQQLPARAGMPLAPPLSLMLLGANTHLLIDCLSDNRGLSKLKLDRGNTVHSSGGN